MQDCKVFGRVAGVHCAKYTMTLLSELSGADDQDLLSFILLSAYQEARPEKDVGSLSARPVLSERWAVLSRTIWTFCAC